jgi:Putative zinc-finger
MRPECEDIQSLTAELALGIASGEDRARVLKHAATCRDCSKSLEQMTGVTDQLLLLAPAEEPPSGFEERVLAQIQPREIRVPLRRRLFRPLVAAAVGAALASGVLVASFNNDVQLASEYRQALAAANGTRFAAVPLRDGAGVKRGSVSMYKGNPSWLVVALPANAHVPVQGAEIVSRSGQRIPLDGFQLRSGVWGGALPLPLEKVASVQLLGPGGRSELVGYMNKNW